MRTHCPKGHPYTSTNTRIDSRGYRHCIVCRRVNHLREYERHHPNGFPPPRDITQCPHGHPWMPETTYTRKDGRRECRLCINARIAEYRRLGPKYERGETQCSIQ